MKIVYIYPALTTIGGADRIITEKANYFAEKYALEVYIITAHQNGKPIFFPLSHKVKHLDLGVDFNKQYNRSFIIRGWIYFRLLRTYKKKLTKALHSIHPDFTITTISRDIDFLTSIKDGSKKIAEAHTTKKNLRNLQAMIDRGGFYKAIGKIWTRKMEKAIKKFDAFVVLTEHDANEWKRIRKAVVIPNSLPFYSGATNYQNNKRVISIGRLEIEKGPDRLIDV
jgi:glycosyltransferase involved in cell wall biosynthesis